jgi:molybdopterin synthase sulfur carrier subunit
VTIAVRLSRALAGEAGSPVDLVVDAGGGLVTLREVLTDVSRQAPAVGRRVRDETGAIRRHVNVFVDDEECRRLAGLDTLVPPGAVVSVIGAVSGG